MDGPPTRFSNNISNEENTHHSKPFHCKMINDQLAFLIVN